MATTITRAGGLQAHIAALDNAGLLVTIDRPIDKDTELHPLVRWQFRGGLAEADRRAFLFTNVTDAKGKKYDIPVVVGALAANERIYAIGMGAPVDKIGETWSRAISAPLEPRRVSDAPCHEVVIQGDDLDDPAKGLESLPIPISTPGFDCAPYFTATNCITRDPETGIQNMGTYRAGLKAPRRLGVRMAVRPGGAGGYPHWLKYQKRGKPMPIAIVVGCAPALSYCGAQKLPRDMDELGVAGAILGAPVDVVRGRTIDLDIPAEAELVIEGLIDPEYLEPEAPFGESHGHIALEAFNMIMAVTAITRKARPVLASIISQVTPSESSVIKRVAYEPMFLDHLRVHLGIKGIRRVYLHEPLTNIRKVICLQVERGTSRTEIWRAMYGAAVLRADCGKYVIAVSDDIDPENSDAVFWSMAYRADPGTDMELLAHRDRGHGPNGDGGSGEESSMLVDATLKGDMPPLALPARSYMEHAKEIWDGLGLPPLRPESPWHGYSLGEWSDEWQDSADRAVAGDWIENGRRTARRRRKGLRPETPVRKVER